MKSSAELFWSILTIDIKDAGDFFSHDVEKCFDMTQVFEKKYSRFIAGNYLNNLNKQKNSEIDAEFFSILNLCLKVSDLTGWYFDITLLPILENAWYGVSTIQLKENIGYKNIVLHETRVELLNWVSIDLGSVGKGYMIDKIFKYLDKKYNNFIIDFWGDIRVKWTHIISLEDPALTPTLSQQGEGVTTDIIGHIELNNTSIASSSWNRRKFWDSHHLMNPKTAESIDDKQAIFIQHKLSSFSDIFSTALFVSPIDIAIKVLNTVPWLEGMIIMSDWKIHKTKNFAWQI